MTDPTSFSDAPLLVRRYVLRAVEGLDLAPYLGATLRGAVGRALRRLVCATRMPVCEGCPVRGACVYAALHDGYSAPLMSSVAPRPATGEAAGTGLHAPPPLWLRDIEPGRRMEPGETISFSVAAFGPAARSLPYVDEAVRSLRREGLGRGRRAVELLEAQDEERGEIGALLAARVARLSGALGTGGLRVVLRTPVAIRLKGAAWAQAGRARPNWGERLVGGAVRRWIALARRWIEVPAAEAPRVRQAVEEASGVSVIEEDVTVRRVRRYSTTEGRHVEMLGAVGAVRLRGEGLLRALPWFAAGEALSVGSGTTFGFGRIHLEAV